MVLAHAVGGAEVEGLLVAGALFLLGVMLFARKAAKPPVAIGLIVAGLGIGAASFAFGGGAGSTDATIAITNPEDGASVAAEEPITIEVDLTGGEVTTHANMADAPPGAGHIHVFVDGELQSMQMTDAPQVTLEPGTHTVEVEFVDADHVSFDPPVIDQIELTAE